MSVIHVVMVEEDGELVPVIALGDLVAAQTVADDQGGTVVDVPLVEARRRGLLRRPALVS